MRNLLVGFVAVLLTSTASNATTYSLDTDPSGTIGAAPFGTITTTVDGSNLDVTVNVSPNFDVDTGSHWALAFDLSTSGLSITGLSSPFYQATGSSFINDPFNASHFNYAIGCSGGGNGKNSCNDATGFSFVIDGAGALAPVLTDGVYFTADIYDSATGKTGVVGAASIVPVPPSLLLMGTILGAGCLGGLWRRRRGSSGAGFAAA